VQILPAAVTPQAISAHIIGLAAGTTYAWRVVAVHATPGAVPRTVAGADFATTAIPVQTTSSPQAGDGAPSPAVAPAAGDAPRITALRVTVAGRTRPHGARRSLLRVSYRDSVAATTSFILERATSGVRHGSHCTARPRRGKAHGRPCTRYVPVRGSFRHRDVAGPNSLELPATWTHGLKPGGYLLVATPTAASGTPGPPTQVRFVIRPSGT
jgi:hypothetical protein